MRRTFQTLSVFALWILVGFTVLQLVPYGRAHSNPQPIAEPAWDSPRTRELAVRACYDCHSNHTQWPWYAHVAPMSWTVQFDVDTGRSVLNFSEWDRAYIRAPYAGRRTADGNMPPSKYLLTHPEARLTDEERAELARGLDATLNPANLAAR
ncbi:MAG: heme-binding domain-containing protein [Deltaproteobacteria bacterium]|nr:heme-binding domain-containing protein [Deltaproteobacteria bacterium]